MREKFYKDLKIIYDYINNRNKEIGGFYKSAISDDSDEKREFLDLLLRKVELGLDKENRMAAAIRVVDLREDSLVQALKSAGADEDRIIKAKEISFEFVADYYLKKHLELLQFIEKNQLLTSFYRKLLFGAHRVGEAFSDFHTSWTAAIINGVNRDLYEAFNGDEEKIFEMLRRENLFDIGHDELEADRSYSVLVHNGEKFESKAYCEAFKEEVFEVVKALKILTEELRPLEDEVFGQKNEYIEYFLAIIDALSEKNRNILVKKWSQVDRKWMKIKTPIQIGHPLEYYEDHYRKAVAMEWDVRMANPTLLENNERSQKIAVMFDKFFDEIGEKNKKIKERVKKNINRVQLYIGQPMFFYGSEFCGLFSAQVVPNDEKVTEEEGKKIFAFSDRVLENIRNRPRMKIDSEIFYSEFLAKEKELIFERSEAWHKVYDISTIGHEYGHVLWLDSDTETLMNKTGNYKNIEEFKATAGGLVSFFIDEGKESEMWEFVLVDTIKRAVKLISWMEVKEVLPYYCEALIHLSGMFEVGIIEFKNNKLSVNISYENYNKLKKWYIGTYKRVGSHYLKKLDASLFLYEFVEKDGENYKPLNQETRVFADYYYELYKKIGRVADE